MIDHEIDRITRSVNSLRPDWPIRQLDTLIREHLRDRPRRDVAIALTWVACDPTSTSPYRVLESGPWWIAVGVDGQTTGRREPFDRTETCHICGRSEQQCRRNPFGDHEYISHADYARQLAHDPRRARKETA